MHNYITCYALLPYIIISCREGLKVTVAVDYHPTLGYTNYTHIRSLLHSYQSCPCKNAIEVMTNLTLGRSKWLSGFWS